MRQLVVILIFLAVLVPDLAYAKRGPKPKVDPVDYQGIRYISHTDKRHHCVRASDIQTGKTLWDVTVYSTFIIPLMEEDVQWVFIKRMFIDGDRLIVVAEDDRAYGLDLKTGAVKRLKQAPPQKAQADNSPAPFIQDGIRIVPPVIRDETNSLNFFNDGGTQLFKITDAAGKKFDVYVDHRLVSDGAGGFAQDKGSGDIYLLAYPGNSNSVRVINQHEFRKKIGDFK